MTVWLFGPRPRREVDPTPTYDAYPDRARPAPRPPRRTWIDRLEERLAGWAEERRRRGERLYDPYEDGPDR